MYSEHDLTDFNLIVKAWISYHPNQGAHVGIHPTVHRFKIGEEYASLPATEDKLGLISLLVIIISNWPIDQQKQAMN